MSAHAPSSPIRSADDWRLRLEEAVDQLADLARRDLEPARFFEEVLSRTIQPGGASRAILWRQSAEGDWQPASQFPAQSRLASASIEQRQALLDEVSATDKPRRVSSLAGDNQSSPLGAAPSSSHIFSPIRYAGQSVGILETEHGLPATGQLPPDTLHFLGALCEVTGDFLSQFELQQLRRARTTWQKWDQYSHRLWQSLELPSVCAAIANDGRLLVECDRVSVLVRHGRSYRLQSVSGVERIEPRSTATRSLESLARLAARHGQTVWRGPGETTDGPTLDPRFEESLQRHFRDSGATGVGIVPVLAPRHSGDRPRPEAVIVFEHFHPLTQWADWQSRGESLAGRSGLTLRAAIERSRIPGLGVWKRLPAVLLRPMTLLVACLLAGVIAALVLIPAEFTVTGPAELWPEHRREVFASTTGIVDQILVSHGDDVQRDQPLLVLRDPELETDTPRIIGEIATVNERLKGVQAARFTGGNTPDALSRARQLTTDEQELKERLRTLELQRGLIEERRAALTLRSPIAGKVLTWDVAQLLSTRPVERGQALLTLGETEGPWIVEVRVPDKDAGYLLRAQQSQSPELDVEFRLSSDTDATYRGHVQEVALNTETDEALRSHVRVIVAFDRHQIAQLRPGATALPRIRCGQRSLGYVWLHDLIEAIRTRLLF